MANPEITPSEHPDYELDEQRVVVDPDVVRAMFDPVRSTVLDLLLDRAASVSELADALDRPRSSIAHHVTVLLDHDLVRVVRTRRVRAIDERFYGRTARLFQVGAIDPDVAADLSNDLVRAADESTVAHGADDLRAGLRHARMTPDDAARFWGSATRLLAEFTSRPRSGDTSYGFVVGLYPSSAPTLPPPDDRGDGATNG